MKKNTCRLCDSKNLLKFLDLGFHPPSDNFLTEEQLCHEEMYYPLDVYSCLDCGLCQLGYVVPPELMFNENYPYESSITKTLHKHFFSMTESICKKFSIKPNSLAIDIGSNVGVLLSCFKEQGLRVLGIEPSSNIAESARQNGIETISEFFSITLSQKIIKKEGRASIITGTNVFAHVDNLDDFVKAVKTLLEENGIFVIEAPYLGTLLDGLEYDTIYHEHLSYLSLKPMIKFFKKHEMDIFDLEMQSIHGGTYRYFICRNGKYPISTNISKFLEMEMKQQIYDEKKLNNFGEDVRHQKLELLDLLIELKRKGKRIVGVSAPAKGNTLLNYCGIDSDMLDYLTERSKLKIGKFTPGTHIKIFNDDMLLKDKPDYALILAWNFASEIISNNKEYLNQGGKFIIPIPKPIIVDNNNLNEFENKHNLSYK